jgi:hypothetical protein
MFLAEAELRDSLIDVVNLQCTTQRQQLIQRRWVCAVSRNKRRFDMGANLPMQIAPVAAPVILQVDWFCIGHIILPFHVQLRI